MIPYPYNMVDMGGIDLAEANCTVVEGLYDKIVEAVNACGDTVLYNWKFAGIEIAPQHTQILLGDDVLTINTLIQVTEQDVVTVLGIAPPPPPVVPVEPLTAYENGVYEATPPASGFNPVNVAVPSAVLVPLSITENGVYDPHNYDADGFNAVTAEVVTPSGGRYQEVESDFFGLATAYQGTDGNFYLNMAKDQCLSFFEAELGAEYVVFLPEQISNRFRVCQWPGKSFSDFEPYLDTPASGPLYTGGQLITPQADLSGDGLFRRFFFTGVSGEIVIGTSNIGTLVKPILLKIQEE